jgi:hypothetical protein
MKTLWHWVKSLPSRIQRRCTRSKRIGEAAGIISRTLAQNLSIHETEQSGDLETVVGLIQQRLDLLVARQADLVELERLLIDEWIPRIAAAAGGNIAGTSGSRDAIERGSAVVDAVESAFARTKPAGIGEPDRIAVGLTRIHEWMFLAEREVSPEVQGVLVRVSKQLAQLMDLAGIRPLISRGRFDPDFQSVVEVRQTTEPTLDLNIAETIRPGYSCAGKLLKPEEVAVHKLQGRQ